MTNLFKAYQFTIKASLYIITYHNVLFNVLIVNNIINKCIQIECIICTFSQISIVPCN